MPKIPMIGAANVEPQFHGQSINAAMEPGLAAAHLGNAVTDIGLQMQAEQVELARSQNFMASISQADDAALKVYSDTVSDTSIPGTQLADTVKTKLQEVHDQVAKNIKDPLVKQRFDEKFVGVMDRHVTEAMNEGFKRSVDDWNAQSNASISTYVKAAATAPEEEVDYYKAQIHGILQNSVAHRAKNKVEAQAIEQAQYAIIDHSQALNAIQKDPAGAAELLAIGKWSSIGPVMQENLIKSANDLARARQRDADTAATKLAAQQAKQLKEEGDHAFAVDLAAADEGTLTHEQLAQDRIKYSWGPESHVLFDRIDSQKEKPSIGQVRDDVAAKLGQWPPAITAQQLDKLRRTSTNPDGPLNGSDWSKFRVELANKSRQIDKEGPTPSQQRAMATANVKNALGGTDAYGPAVSELNHKFSSGNVTDPVAEADAVIAKYKPNAVNIKPFNAAMDKLKAAQVGVDMQQFNHMLKTEILGNPKLEGYQNARDKVLSEAEKAHRIVGNDISHAADGTRKPLPDGRMAVVLGGKVIIE